MSATPLEHGTVPAQKTRTHRDQRHVLIALILDHLRQDEILQDSAGPKGATDPTKGAPRTWCRTLSASG